MPIMFFIHVQQNQLMLIMLFDCVQTTAADAHDAFHLYLNNIRIYICCTIYTCIYAHVFSRMYVTYTYIYIYVCVCAYICCMYVYVYIPSIYICICMSMIISVCLYIQRLTLLMLMMLLYAVL